MSGRRLNAIVGMVFGYGTILVALARNVLFVPIYLHAIPLAEYGSWLATGGALALLLINDFGLSGVVSQKVSACFGAGDLTRVGSLIGSAVAIGSIMAMGLTVISMALVPLLPGLESLSELERKTVTNCFLLAIAANALGLIGGTAAGVLRSLQRSALAGSIFLLADLINIGLLLILLVNGKGLYAIAVGILVRATLIALAGSIAMWFVCCRALEIEVTLSWLRVRELLGSSSQFFFCSIAMKVQTQANVFFVNSILGPTSAAIFSLTVRAHETVQLLLGQVNTALVPSMTHLFGSGNLLRFRVVLLRMLLTLACISALAMSLTIILNAGFLRLWVGEYAFAGQKVSILMGGALFVALVGSVGYDALVAQGEFKLVSKVFAFTSLLQVILLLLFLDHGLWIAPTATLFTGSVWGLLFWRSVARDVGITRVEVYGLLSQLGRIVAFSTLTICVSMLVYPMAKSWTALIIESLVSTSVLVGGYLLLSAKLRIVVREEIGMTIRAMRLT